MREKLKQFWRVAVLATVVLLAGCEKELYEDQIEQSRVKTVSLKNLPFLQQSIAKMKMKMKVSNKEGIDYLSLIDTTEVRLYENLDGSKDYTFALQLYEQNKLTNLVIKQYGEEYYYKLIEYTSTNYTQWIEDVKANGFSMEPMQVELFDLNKIGGACFVHAITCSSGLHSSTLGNLYQCRLSMSEWGVVTYQVPCVDGNGGGGYGGSGGGTGTGSGGGGGGGVINTAPKPCTRCDFTPNETPCEQLKNRNNKAIANTTPPKTVVDNLKDLKNNMAANPRERFFALTPTSAAEDEFVESYTEGALNGAEVALSLYQNAVTAFMHCHYSTSLLSIFSLSDLQQMYFYTNTGNIYNPSTFTSYLVTAHGTQYAIKFNGQSYSSNFFLGWEADGIKYIREEEYKKKVDVSNSIQSNELGFLQFIKQQQMGFELYRANSDFSQWTKLSLNPQGTQIIEVPCPQ